MSPLVIAVVALALLNLGVLAWLLFGARRSGDELASARLEAAIQSLRADLLGRQSESFLALRESLDAANQIVNSRLAEGTSLLDRRMAPLGEIENRLGQLAEQARNIEQIGRNIQSLSELLRPPKLRGALGELLLENLLTQILPRPMFELQHQFPGGQRVDAVIRIGDRLLPIDSKFPLESFERMVAGPDDPAPAKEFTLALKRHIDAISSRYLRPNDGTTEYAVMYIPSEAIYYQLISLEDRTGLDYALASRVIPSSPGHLYAFLASLVAVHSGTGLLSSGLADEGRRLLAGLNELAEALERLAGLHLRIEGSTRSLSASLERARGETAAMQRRLEALREPTDGSAVSKSEPPSSEQASLL